MGQYEGSNEAGMGGKGVGEGILGGNITILPAVEGKRERPHLMLAWSCLWGQNPLTAELAAWNERRKPWQNNGGRIWQLPWQGSRYPYS